MSESELYHWKYIKRVWKKGRWRYYYDTKSLSKDIGIDKLKEYNAARSNLKTATENKNNAGHKAARSAKKLSQDKYATFWTQMPKWDHQKNMAALNKSVKEYNKAQKRVDKALRELGDTPIGRFLGY